MRQWSTRDVASSYSLPVPPVIGSGLQAILIQATHIHCRTFTLFLPFLGFLHGSYAEQRYVVTGNLNGFCPLMPSRSLPAGNVVTPLTYSSP